MSNNNPSRARVGGRSTAGPFKYKDRGQLATIGRHSAVCNFGRIQVTGYLGWWLWGMAHIYFLIGFRNRLVVAANWFWSYLTFGRGIRLITGDVQQPESETKTRTVPQARKPEL